MVTPLFNHYESSVPAQDPQDGGNSTGLHHTVTRSGRVVRHPDYYGMSGDTYLNYDAHNHNHCMCYPCVSVRGEVCNRLGNCVCVSCIDSLLLSRELQLLSMCQRFHFVLTVLRSF